MIRNLFKRKLKLVQQAYDMGWNHGYNIGKKDNHHEIIELLVDNIESIDWLKEEPMQAMDVLTMVKKHNAKELAVDNDEWRKPE